MSQTSTRNTQLDPLFQALVNSFTPGIPEPVAQNVVHLDIVGQFIAFRPEWTGTHIPACDGPGYEPQDRYTLERGLVTCPNCLEAS